MPAPLPGGDASVSLHVAGQSLAQHAWQIFNFTDHVAIVVPLTLAAALLRARQAREAGKRSMRRWDPPGKQLCGCGLASTGGALATAAPCEKTQQAQTRDQLAQVDASGTGVVKGLGGAAFMQSKPSSPSKRT